MRETIAYQVATGRASKFDDAVEMIELEIKDKLPEGWEPFGSISCSMVALEEGEVKYLLCQAMVIFKEAERR